MAQGDDKDRAELFLRRARHLNLAFISAVSLVFVASLATYEFFSMPVSFKLLLYVYGLEAGTGLLAYSLSFLLRRRFPVRTSEDLWSYRAVRVYFWSYTLLCVPFGVSFLFYLFAGSLSALILGYLISICGLIIFRPREGDVL
jgi:uncharacterized membrane protein